MRPLAAVAVAALSLAAAACGGDEGKEQARGEFEAYRAASTERTKAENELGKAFREIARAAGKRDRRGVTTAAKRGRTAAAKIDELLEAEIDAAAAMAEYEPAAKDARALIAALRRSGRGLKAVKEQLTIAARDPLLDEPENEEQVRRLSKQSLRLSVPAAFARRRAVTALARALGV